MYCCLEVKGAHPHGHTCFRSEPCLLYVPRSIYVPWIGCPVSHTHLDTLVWLVEFGGGWREQEGGAYRTLLWYDRDRCARVCNICFARAMLRASPAPSASAPLVLFRMEEATRVSPRLLVCACLGGIAA